ncbi:hypothetical protein SK128_022593 [Halocaridina rubra]|uniref:Uncharacterized protein n=1 Tax=Halocaridina rubra TaxID=373956 RepID=A0AAN9A4M0_HALRR
MIFVLTSCSHSIVSSCLIQLVILSTLVFVYSVILQKQNDVYEEGNANTPIARKERKAIHLDLKVISSSTKEERRSRSNGPSSSMKWRRACMCRRNLHTEENPGKPFYHPDEDYKSYLGFEEIGLGRIH